MSGWRLNKDVSVADVVSIVLVGIGIIIGYVKLDSRVAAVERALPQQISTDVAVLKSQLDGQKETLERLERTMLRLEVKIDKPPT